MSANYIVTLVHGTWARRADWARPDSTFSKELRARLKGTVTIEAFEWSGYNLHRARLKAARRLAATLAAKDRRFPEAKQIVIAHSHGGNVVAYALRDPAAAAAVHGVVSLATPFIRVSPRNASTWIAYLAKAALIEAYAIAILLSYALTIGVTSYSHDRLVETFLLRFGPIFLVPTLLGLFSWLYLGRMAHYCNALSEKICKLEESRYNELALGQNAWSPMLSVTVKRDEPGLLLSVLAIVTRFLDQLFSKDSLLFLYIVVFPWLLIYSDVFSNETIFGATNHSVWEMLSAFDYWFVWELLVACELVLAPMLITLLAICSLLAHKTLQGVAYGEESWFVDWLLKISHENRPLLWALVTQKEFIVKPKWWRFWSPLSHSLVHGESVIIDNIASWIFSLPLDPDSMVALADANLTTKNKKRRERGFLQS